MRCGIFPMRVLRQKARSNVQIWKVTSHALNIELILLDPHRFSIFGLAILEACANNVLSWSLTRLASTKKGFDASGVAGNVDSSFAMRSELMMLDPHRISVFCLAILEACANNV